MTKSDAFHMLQTFLLLGVIVVLWFVWEKVSVVYDIAKRSEREDLIARNLALEERYMREGPLDWKDLDEAVDRAGFHDYGKGMPPP